MSSQASAIEFLSHEFCEALGAVFEQTAGEAYVLEQSGNKAADDSGEGLKYVLKFSGKASGRAFVCVDLHTAAILATRLMGSPVDESTSYLPEHEDAILEIVSQTGGSIATALRTRFGVADVTVAKAEGDAETGVTVVLEGAKKDDHVSVQLLCSKSLIDSLATSMTGQEHLAAEAAPSAAPDVDAERQNLRLVMDVELDLTLRFGQRMLMLSEVADLTTGSVVELDRLVDEPVELLLGERVIAQGEVVIVDGNYGLRITHILPIDQNSLLSA
jgi:flagellar motor switch protein FliN